VSGASDGAKFVLGASTVTWASEVSCSGKTLTITGAGKGATVLDAGEARRFFELGSGCTLMLNGLSLRNGNGLSLRNGGAIYANRGSTLNARDVEFKDNSAIFVRHSAPPPRHAVPPPAPVRAAAAVAHTHPTPTHPPARRPLPLTAPAALACDCATQGGAVYVKGTASFTSCDFTSNSATMVRLPLRRPCPRAPPPPSLTHTSHPHPPSRPLPASPHRPRRTRVRLRASQAGAVYVYYATITFASTLPVNSFLGNTAVLNNYGNCYKNTGATFIGSCS
jgi:hypothetical protein